VVSRSRILGARLKEGAKRIGRPAGNSESWDDDEKCRGWYPSVMGTYQIKYLTHVSNLSRKVFKSFSQISIL